MTNPSPKTQEFPNSLMFRFQELIDNSEDGVIAYDTECRYTLWNPVMETFTGYSREEVLGKNAFEIFPYLKTMGLDNPFYETLKGKTVDFKETHFKNERGREVFLESRNFPIRSEDGEVVGGFAIIHNVTARKKIEEALRQSEDKFRKVFEEAPIPMLLTHRRRLVEVNRALCELLGYSPGEMLGKMLHDFLHPDDHSQSDDMGQQLAERKISRFQMLKRYLHKDGHVIWGNATATSLPDAQDGGGLAVAMIEDVTERKKFQESLQNSESNLRAVFNSGSQMIALIDKDGFLREFNRNADETMRYMTGQGYEKNRPFLDFVPADIRGACQENFNKVLGGESITVERCLPDREGNLRWFEFTFQPIQGAPGEITGICLSAVMIDDRRRAQQALRESEERYRLLVEVLPEAVVVHSDGKVLFVNSSGLKALGAVHPQEVVGKSILEIIHPDSRETALARIREIQEKGSTRDFVELKMVRRDGQILDLETKGVSFTYQGRPSVLTIIRDITERKKNQNMLLRYERLAAVGKAIAAIAHEVRNPLMAVAGTSEILRDKVKAQPDLARDVATLLEQTARLKNFMDDILDYSREMSVKKGTVNPKSLLEKSLKLVQAQPGGIPEGIKIVWEIEKGLPNFQADGERLEQVLVNVLWNAFQAMEKEGTLTLSAYSQNDYLFLEVRDTGPGINESLLPHLFEPFFSTKKQGTGLGLAISQKIMEAHGGLIALQRATPRGTRCILQLPLQKS